MGLSGMAIPPYHANAIGAEPFQIGGAVVVLVVIARLIARRG